MQFPKRRIEFQGTFGRRNGAFGISAVHQSARQSTVVRAVPRIQFDKALQVELRRFQLKPVVEHCREALKCFLVARIQLKHAKSPLNRFFHLVLNLTTISERGIQLRIVGRLGNQR